MTSLKPKAIPKYFLPIALMALFSSLVLPVYGERVISFEKVVDINKQVLENFFVNPNNFPKVFPENVKSVQLTVNSDNRKVANMMLGFNGFPIYSEIEIANSQTKNTL